MLKHNQETAWNPFAADSGDAAQDDPGGQSNHLDQRHRVRAPAGRYSCNGL